MTEKPKRQSKQTSDITPKILSQEELLKWWPFQRVNGQSLENLHRKQIVEQTEQAPF
jgi:hypothetical protein